MQKNFIKEIVCVLVEDDGMEEPKLVVVYD